MTGEITLRGRVWPIAGLKEKLLAALRGGIKTVLIQKCRQAKHVGVERARPQTVPGETCPKCGELGFRIERSVKHHQLGVLGGRIHFMKCTACEFAEERVV
jgi:predicted S18 family serine protease